MTATKTPVLQAFLFQPLTRAQYKDLMGVQAPPYVVNQRIKRWRDPNPTSENPTYSAYDPATKAVVSITMSAAEARAVNLPGAYDWPKFSVPPNPARILDDQRREISGFDVMIICDEAEADKVATEIGGTVYEEPIVYDPYVVDWRGETRRQWMILWRGQTLRASALIQAKYLAGVGAPGKWDLSGPSPAWISEKAPEGAWSAMPEIPFPMMIGAGQTLESTGFGSFDAAIVTQESPSPTVSGGFGDVDRAMLTYIKGTVQVIAGNLKLPV